MDGIEEVTEYQIVRSSNTSSKSRKRLVKDLKGKKSKKVKKISKNEFLDSNEPDELKDEYSDSNEPDELKDEYSDSKEPNKLDMSEWCNCFVPNSILMALKELGFHKPTPIQELAIPAAIRDHQDILGAAETGSGKTLAFGIPMISHIISRKEREKLNDSLESNPLRGLVLTPTRELAIQVKNHLLAITKYTDVKVDVIVGGMSSDKQKRILKKCPDIVIATPGRLWELIEEGEDHLSDISIIRHLVIDEADRMVEKGHFQELTQILSLINGGETKHPRQNYVFSATLTMIHKVPKRFSRKNKKGNDLKKQKLESIVGLIGMKKNPKIIDITKKTALVDNLTESQIKCSLEEKDLYLYYFLNTYPGRTLVFCNSIDCVRRLRTILEYLKCEPLPLHASMHQKQRLKNLERFASSKNDILLATDVAARGLDIKGIEHVIHYQVPRTAEIYVHRSGRTARAQNEGLSLMLVDPQDAIYYRNICKTLNKDRVLPSFPTDHNIIKILKDRITLAHSIDKLEHRMKKLSAQNRWFVNAAKDMEVEIDDDEKLLNDLGDARENAAKTRQINAMKKQLHLLLKKPLISTMFSGSYPTQTGKLLFTSTIGTEKAVEVMANINTIASRKKKNKMFNLNKKTVFK